MTNFFNYNFETIKVTGFQRKLTLKNIGKVALNYNKDVKFFTDKSQLNQALCDFLKPNDIVLFKASRGMRLEETIDYIYDRKD